MTQTTIDFAAATAAANLAATHAATAAKLASMASMRNAKYSKKTQAAIAKYGREVCVEAWRMNSRDGEGPNTVAIYLGLNTADGRINTAAAIAAMNAGEEIAGE